MKLKSPSVFHAARFLKVNSKVFLTLISQVILSPTKFTKKIYQKVANKEFIAWCKKVYKIHKQRFARQKIYQEWIKNNCLTQEQLDHQRLASRQFLKKPLISFITPVFNPPVGVLEELIKSVLAQTYDNFELCLGNFGENQEVKQLLAKYSEIDSRIKVWQLENKGISENSNEILARSKGEYIALLDHDDLIEPNALYENIELLNKADYDLIYSDSDKINEFGKRFDPFFKPDWSPETILTANYVTHFDVIKKKVIDEIGGWDPATDGAQDWDLFLRIAEHTDKIAHVPKILYHWRTLSTSTANSMEAKPYVINGQQNAVNKYLKTHKYPAKARHNKTELYLDWEKLPAQDTVCIVRSNSIENLSTFLSDAKAQLQGSRITLWVFHEYQLPKTYESRQKHLVKRFIKVEKNNFIHQLIDNISSIKQVKNVWFFDDRLQFLYGAAAHKKNLGWLNIENVSAAAPRVMDDKKINIDSGAGIIAENKIVPLFLNSPVYNQTSIGNIEMVRNLRLLNHLSFFTTNAWLKKAQKTITDFDNTPNECAYTFIQLALSSEGRLVFDPKSAIIVQEDSAIDTFVYYEKTTVAVQKFLDNNLGKDPYLNESLYKTKPKMLEL